MSLRETIVLGVNTAVARSVEAETLAPSESRPHTARIAMPPSRTPGLSSPTNMLLVPESDPREPGAGSSRPAAWPTAPHAAPRVCSAPVPA